MAAVQNPARAFVNLIIGEYDKGCHSDTPGISDVFDPQLEDGLKEKSLSLYSKRFSNPPPVIESDPASLDIKPDLQKKMTDDQLDAEVVTNYKQIAPTLSHLFAVTGILDTHLQTGVGQKLRERIFKILGWATSPGSSLCDRKLQIVKQRIIEVLVQDHLRRKKYEIDPISDGKRHFYAEIFQSAYSRISVEGKKKLIQQLKEFEPVLNSRLAQLQRVVFKVEGTFNHFIANKYVKLGICVAVGIGSYQAVTYKIIPFAVKVFNSTTFIAFSSLVVSRLPVVVIQITNGAYTRVMGLVVYVASTRWYQYKLMGRLQVAPKIIPIIVPIMSWVYAPVATLAFRIFSFGYDRSFGPDARTQMVIWENLTGTAEEKKELLDGGMKAYQVWMYLMEQGPKEGLFN